MTEAEQELQQLVEACAQASNEYYALPESTSTDDLFHDPRCPAPEALRPLPGDADLEISHAGEREFYCAPCEIDPLRRPRNKPSSVVIYNDADAEKLFPNAEKVIVLHKQEPWPEAQRRADEIVAAYNAWEAQQRAAGVTDREKELEAASDALIDTFYQHFEALCDLETPTWRGIKIKLAFFEEKFEANGTKVMGLDESDFGQLAWSIVHDLSEVLAKQAA